ncbi:MAG: long-chain fatty acid--CoA ligase [Alphaproteobacteria bacterium]|nr:MAG: long-chain fatty acid--CoA ligase [Alphaproteobacteria bacterium]
MFSLTQGLRRALQTRPAAPSTAFGTRRRTWEQTADRVARVAGALAALGIKRGDRVAILALNSDRYFELMYALPWIGAVMVPLNTRLAAPEIEYILEDSGAVGLFIDAAMAHHLSALEGRMAAVREVIWLDDISSPDGMLHYEDLTAYDMADDLGAANDETAGLFYTGGTTGRSKGVMLSHANLVVNAMNAVAGMGFDSDTAYIHSGAMFHLADGASTFGVTLVGGRHAFVPRFEPVEVLQTIAGEKVTHAQFVPTMINMMVNHPRFGEFDISTLKLVLYGASPMPEGVLRKAIEVMAHVGMIHGYGMTEAAPIVTLLPARYTTLSGPYAGRLKSCGQAALTCEVKVVDANREEVPRGTAGELAIRGPNIMKGYWNKPDETAAVLENGWYYSGDGATMDKEGFVFIVDRLKDMIITGGENVYSAEVENAISLIPGVGEVAVIGVPDERWGERVHAIIVPKPGTNLTADLVLAHCREQIAGYKCPRSVDFRNEPLPLSGAGKVLKRELREPYWKGYTKAVN